MLYPHLTYNLYLSGFRTTATIDEHAEEIFMRKWVSGGERLGGPKFLTAVSNRTSFEIFCGQNVLIHHQFRPFVHSCQWSPHFALKLPPAKMNMQGTMQILCFEGVGVERFVSGDWYCFFPFNVDLLSSVTVKSPLLNNSSYYEWHQVTTLQSIPRHMRH